MRPLTLSLLSWMAASPAMAQDRRRGRGIGRGGPARIRDDGHGSSAPGERGRSRLKEWFMPGFDYLDDPRHPRHKQAAFKIRDYITEAISSDPEIHTMNQRNYDRYDRYGGQFGEEDFKLPMVGGVLIHTALKGSRAPAPGSSRDFNPKVTIWSGTTEAPDETAEGDWLKLVARAGLKWDQATLPYLLDGEHAVEGKGSGFLGGVSLSLDRPRPPKEEEESALPAKR